MAESSDPFQLREILLFLTLAGILIPLLQRLRINQILGFMTVGVLLGPHSLGQAVQGHPWLSYFAFSRPEGVAVLAQFGVVFLMFTIGLELSAERLWSMRRWVFGAGSAQVILSAAAIGAIAYAFGNSREAALLIGLALALSSTAVVMQILVQRKALGTALGRASFSILLLQDLAVVPLLILVAVLGSRPDSGVAAMLGSVLVKAGVAVGLIYLVGRRVIRPLFRHFAAAQQADVFMALTLLSTLGIATLTWLAGLSAALGAFLAGLLLAETEYRHEVEVTIEPFKGLLMGLFFMSVGMAVDPLALIADPLMLPASIVGLLAIKAAIAAAVLRVAGLTNGRALEGGLLLAQGGEFALILIGAAMLRGLLDAPTGQFMLLLVALSMFTTAPLSALGHKLGNTLDATRRDRTHDADRADIADLEGHVIIAGFGRVGQLIAQVLDAQRVPYVALDSDADLVAKLHGAGQPVFFGNASRPELLRRVHIESAAAVVLTMDHAAAAMHTLQSIRREFAHIPVYARAKDEKHALALKGAGATMVIPVTLESGLQLAGFVLDALGTPEDAVRGLLAQERERRIARFAGEP